MTTALWSAFNLNRDSLGLFWSKWIAFALALAALGTDITKVGLPASWAPYLALIAMFIGASAAQHRTSPLEGE